MIRPVATRRVLLLASLFLAGSASADPLPSINLRGFSPPPGANGSVYLESVNTPGAWQWNVGAWASWAYRPLVIRRNDEVVGKLIRQQTTADVTAAIGLGKRVEVGLIMPFVLRQGYDNNAETQAVLQGSTPPHQAVGDLTIAAKVTLKEVDEEFGGLGLALVGRVSTPTGDRESTLGEGQVTTEARLLGELRVLGASLQGTAGFKVRPSERDFGGKTWGNEIPWGVGAFLRPKILGIDKKDHWRFGLESHGSLPAGPDAPFTSVAQSPVFLAVSARYSARDVHVQLAAESGISHGAGAAPFRGMLGVTWAPREHDQDHDGVEDDVDVCKTLPEDKDGFEDSDGCPDPDNDDDGVLDAEDKCPGQAEDQDDFDDEDGCPDPDNDGDGILDKDDKCPNKAGPPSDDPKRNGCPNVDGDGDGILDKEDKCPNEPEDKDGFEDADGCPDPDNDKDGVPDAQDACPLEKGETSADPKKNGCASDDRDHDGIANTADKCPDQPETYNGFEDEDGCPEADSPKHRPLIATTTKQGVVLMVPPEGIRFEKKSEEFDKRSLPTIRALGTWLAMTPGATIAVAVRPSPTDGGDEMAKKRAEHLARMIGSIGHRPEAVSTKAWEKGKMGPKAEVSGVYVDGQGKAPEAKAPEAKTPGGKAP